MGFNRCFLLHLLRMNLFKKNIPVRNLKLQFLRFAGIVQHKLHRPEIEPGLRFRPF